MTLNRIVVLASCLGMLSLTLLCPSTSHAMGGKKTSPDSATQIQLSSGIPSEQRALLEGDFRFLKTYQDSQPDPELLRLMKLPKAEGVLLGAWLDDRVQFVVDQDLDLKSALFLESSSYRYENPSLFPVMEKSEKKPDDSSTVKTVMSNIGTAVYAVGKKSGSLLGLNLPGLERVKLTSPRSGVIQVGEGLFRPLLRKTGSKEVSSPGNSLSRLATLFHEARHSDGNGKSLGFFHAVCPAGHTYEGYSACDRNLNGPYTVGASVEASFAKNCPTCSIEEREALRLGSLDSFDRVIKETPEEDSIRSSRNYVALLMARTDLLVCRSYEKVDGRSCEKELQRLTELEKAAQQDVRMIPSTEWDDLPEGQR